MRGLTVQTQDALSAVPEAAWDALCAGDPDATPFQRWRWLEALERCGCAVPSRGWHPRHLTVWRGGELVAAAPAYARDDSGGEFVFDGGWAAAAQRAGLAYYPKLVLAVPFTPVPGQRVLVAPGEDRAALEALVFHAAEALCAKEGYPSVHLLFPREATASQAVTAGWARRLGVQFHWQNAGYRAYDDFLARFPSRKRKNLRKERDAAGSQGIALSTRRGRDGELGPEDRSLLWRLYCSTVDKYVWGRRYLTEGFFARALESFPEHLELVEARREGRVIAGALNVASGSHLYGRYWGCFEEHPFLHFHVCYYHAIDACIARGVRTFEGGAGGEHKLSRGFEPTLTLSAHRLFHPGLDRAVRDFLRREEEGLRAALPGLRAASGLRPLEAPGDGAVGTVGAGDHGGPWAARDGALE
jgi:predicted N-acyltransferase